MLELFVICILFDNPGISFVKCSLFSYVSLCEWDFTVFCIVFLVRNAGFLRVSLKCFVFFLVSLPLYGKVTLFLVL
jgi:hypothetical protein